MSILCQNLKEPQNPVTSSNFISNLLKLLSATLFFWSQRFFPEESPLFCSSLRLQAVPVPWMGAAWLAQGRCSTGCAKGWPERWHPASHCLLCSGCRGTWSSSLSRAFLLQSTPRNSYTSLAQGLLSNVHLVLSRKVLRTKKERVWLYFLNHNILIRMHEIPVNRGATYFFILYSFSVH